RNRRIVRPDQACLQKQRDGNVSLQKIEDHRGEAVAVTGVPPQIDRARIAVPHRQEVDPHQPAEQMGVHDRSRKIADDHQNERRHASRPPFTGNCLPFQVTLPTTAVCQYEYARMARKNRTGSGCSTGRMTPNLPQYRAKWKNCAVYRTYPARNSSPAGEFRSRRDSSDSTRPIIQHAHSQIVSRRRRAMLNAALLATPCSALRMPRGYMRKEISPAPRKLVTGMPAAMYLPPSDRSSVTSELMLAWPFTFS